MKELIQFKDPSFHSWKSPNKSTNKNSTSPIIKNTDPEKIKKVSTGNNNAISTSKIKNNTTKIKNRVEKGARISLKGSNPHSKADNFSVELWERKLVKKNTTGRAIPSTRANIKDRFNKLVYSLGE